MVVTSRLLDELSNRNEMFSPVYLGCATGVLVDLSPIRSKVSSVMMNNLRGGKAPSTKGTKIIFVFIFAVLNTVTIYAYFKYFLICNIWKFVAYL